MGILKWLGLEPSTSRQAARPTEPAAYAHARQRQADQLAHRFSLAVLAEAHRDNDLTGFAQGEVRGITGVPDDGYNEAVTVLLLRNAGLI